MPKLVLGLPNVVGFVGADLCTQTAYLEWAAMLAENPWIDIQ